MKKPVPTLILLLSLFALPLSGCAKAPTTSSKKEEADEPHETETIDESETDISSAETSEAQEGETETEPNEPLVPEPEPVKECALYIRCTGENVNLRAGAGTSYAVLGQAEKDTMYAVTGKNGNWYKTFYQNQTAYIYSSYVEEFEIEKSGDEAVEAVIAEGYKTLGVPYVYGAVRLHDGSGNLLRGFTKNKFDCSSLMQYIFYHGADVLLQTTTRTQVSQGQYVARSELKRGDCIYFTNASRQYNTGLERVGHVALYLGDGYILHTSSDYARIEKMTATRWGYYIEARRFV
jgi:cell wall-associated NlpC family hydrolase